MEQLGIGLAEIRPKLRQFWDDGTPILMTPPEDDPSDQPTL